MSFPAEGSRRDSSALSELKSELLAPNASGAQESHGPRLRSIPSDDSRGFEAREGGSQTAPWTQRRLNEVLAELGPVRPVASPDETVEPPGESTGPSSLADTAMAAAAALSRHSPLLAKAALSPTADAGSGDVDRLPRTVAPASLAPPLADTGLARPEIDATSVQGTDHTAFERAIDASQIVRAIAETCDRETVFPMPPPVAPQRVAAPPPPLPPPPPAQMRARPADDANDASDGELVPSWFVVPRPAPASLLADEEAGERPPMIIERAIAEAEYASSLAAGASHSGRLQKVAPNPWPPVAAGFGLAMATGAVLYAVLIAG